MGERLQELLDVIRVVCQEENLKVTIKNSARSGLYAAGGAVIGCMLAGPWGGVPGAAAGAAAAAATGESFRPLFQVIGEWPDESKEQLAEKVRAILSRVDIKDVAAITAMATGAASVLRAEIAGAVIDYCNNEMMLEVARR
ncbi:uncharacterized protein CEXT_590781 [Caerostris extrusa]|uniref:Uncharacterized protein n=1 Tax=Caerostris extrusa TaxID=172846 RepID=A0AAV4VTN5_CAEEX|nr:uncharacterized protein CEXT_590781 [Caerostris extrusa]